MPETTKIIRTETAEARAARIAALYAVDLSYAPVATAYDLACADVAAAVLARRTEANADDLDVWA